MAGVVPGTLKVSNDCIADLAGYAALDCYGIVGIRNPEKNASIFSIAPHISCFLIKPS